MNTPITVAIIVPKKSTSTLYIVTKLYDKYQVMRYKDKIYQTMYHDDKLDFHTKQECENAIHSLHPEKLIVMQLGNLEDLATTKKVVETGYFFELSQKDLENNSGVVAKFENNVLTGEVRKADPSEDLIIPNQTIESLKTIKLPSFNDNPVIASESSVGTESPVLDFTALLKHDKAKLVELVEKIGINKITEIYGTEQTNKLREELNIK